MDVANKEEAEKCLLISERALQVGEVAKAERFCQKAQKLFSTDQVIVVLAFSTGLQPMLHLRQPITASQSPSPSATLLQLSAYLGAQWQVLEGVAQ